MWLLLASVLVSGVTGPVTLDGLLARQLSPGVAYLLFAHGSEERVRARLAEGLLDPRPEVRAACARGIYVVGAHERVAALARALAVEQDLSAAREMIRALVWAGGPAGVDSALAAAKRLGPPLPVAWMRTLALVKGSDAVPLYLARRPELGTVSWREEATFYLEATRRAGEALATAASRTLGAGDSESWRAVLEALLETRQPLDQQLLEAALDSKSAAVRAETVWYVLAARREDARPKALLAAPDPDAPPLEDPDLAFAFELARRSHGEPAVSDARWSQRLAERRPSRLYDLHSREPRAAARVLRLLTAEEVAALTAVGPT